MIFRIRSRWRAVKEDGHAEKVCRSFDGARAADASRRDPRLEGVVDEGAEGAGAAEMRRRWPELDRSTDRRCVRLSDQDRGEYPAAAGHGRLRRNAPRQEASDATAGENSGWRTGGEGHRRTLGQATEGICQLVATLVGRQGR